MTNRIKKCMCINHLVLDDCSARMAYTQNFSNQLNTSLEGAVKEKEKTEQAVNAGKTFWSSILSLLEHPAIGNYDEKKDQIKFIILHTYAQRYGQAPPAFNSASATMTPQPFDMTAIVQQSGAGSTEHILVVSSGNIQGKRMKLVQEVFVQRKCGTLVVIPKMFKLVSPAAKPRALVASSLEKSASFHPGIYCGYQHLLAEGMAVYVRQAGLYFLTDSSTNYYPNPISFPAQEQMYAIIRIPPGQGNKLSTIKIKGVVAITGNAVKLGIPVSQLLSLPPQFNDPQDLLDGYHLLPPSTVENDAEPYLNNEERDYSAEPMLILLCFAHVSRGECCFQRVVELVELRERLYRRRTVQTTGGRGTAHDGWCSPLCKALVVFNCLYDLSGKAPENSNHHLTTTAAPESAWLLSQKRKKKEMPSGLLLGVDFLTLLATKATVEEVQDTLRRGVYVGIARFKRAEPEKAAASILLGSPRLRLFLARDYDRRP
ncbi:hypothetical protein BDP27DRAFT_1362909 [Rhodocollybia butyracea]|uniref:Uncharacterized protein n=1 Tax=Rhodocollybia butyracea TaxID=206335 RepID=A0A9P5PVC3_9AGAR|nr:hypothetical protein BDP27DRAFT_1362909 [Rhodocollybia butyracea]